jgi:hypothetical protein
MIPPIVEEVAGLLDIKDAHVAAMGDPQYDRLFVLFEKDQRYLYVMILDEPGQDLYLTVSGPYGDYDGYSALDDTKWWKNTGAILCGISENVIDRSGWNKPYRSFVSDLEEKFK